MFQKICLIGEQRNQLLKKSTLEICSAAKAADYEVHAIVIGHQIASLAQDLSDHGASKVYLADHEQLKFYSAETSLEVLLPWVQAVKPDYIFASHTPLGKDLLPRLAARLESGLASDCTEALLKASPPTFRRPLYAGKASAEVEFLAGSPFKLVTFRPNALGNPRKFTSSPAVIEKLNVQLGPQKTQVLEVLQGVNARPDVSEASIVISGGRSLKNAENFKILEKLADTVGAAVGASRAAVDAGYRPHRDQVGQTGKVVSPSLYIACGISGAIQHLAGMRSSKIIAAINTDPEAPIFQIADYGVVADLFEVVPLLEQEFKKLREH